MWEMFSSPNCFFPKLLDGAFISLLHLFERELQKTRKEFEVVKEVFMRTKTSGYQIGESVHFNWLV